MTARGRCAAGLALALALFAVLPVAAQGRPVAKIAVAASGAVTLDGRAVALPELRAALRDLARAKGEVWYWRDDPAAEPPPAALQVMDAVIAAGVPIRFATRPDFTAFEAPPDAAPRAAP